MAEKRIAEIHIPMALIEAEKRDAVLGVSQELASFAVRDQNVFIPATPVPAPAMPHLS